VLPFHHDSCNFYS